MGVFSNKAQQNNTQQTSVSKTGGGMFARIAQQQEQEKQPSEKGFLGNVASGILKTPARLATNVINAGQVATGNEATQPFSGKFLGEIKPIGTEGTFGQKVKESVGAGLEMASYLPVGRAVSAGVNLAKEPFKQTVIQGAKTLGKEGLVQGALGGAGRSMADNKGLGEIIVNTVLGSAAGGLLGTGLGATTAGISRALTKKPIDAIKRETIDATSKALGLSGKRPATKALVQPEQYTRGLATIRKYADNFDPKSSENIFDDTLKGLVSAKDKVFHTYDSIANQAGSKGVEVDILPLENSLRKFTEGITTRPKQLRAERILSELRQNFPSGKANPAQFQTYLKLLNEELGGLTGGAEKGAVGVVSEFSKSAREALDSAVSKTGKEYQIFRDEYASLKTIEDSLVRQYQKAMRKKGSGLSEFSDLAGNAEMISSIISGNPALMARGAVIKAGAKYIKAINDPETYLRRAFEGIDNLGDEFTPKRIKTPQLLLKSGKEGLPQSQVNTPLNLGSRSQSTIDAQEISRIQSQPLLKSSQITKETNLATKIPSATAISVAKNPISKTLPRPKDKSIGTVDKLKKPSNNKGLTTIGTLLGGAGATGAVLAGQSMSKPEVYKASELPTKTATPKRVKLDLPTKANTVGDYNFSKYASDKNAIKRLQDIFSAMQDVSTPEKAQAEIIRVSPDSPVTGKMIIDSAKEWGVDPKIILTLIRNESDIGTAKVARETNNPGNILNTDDGAKYKYPTILEGIRAVARELQRRKLKQNGRDN